MAYSNNQVAKLWINLDPLMSVNKPVPESINFKDAKSSSSGVRLCILAFTGSKTQTNLDDVSQLVTPRSDGEESEIDGDEELEVGRRRTADELATAIQDVRYIMPGHMPKYLRIDHDIKEGLLRLTDLMKKYSNFDVLALERDVTRTLELELDKQSADYKRHNRATEKRLAQAAEKLEQCIILKD